MTEIKAICPICPKCKKPGQCFHEGDVGAGSSYEDQYRFNCPNPECDYSDSTKISGGDSSFMNTHTKCPYCGQ